MKPLLILSVVLCCLPAIHGAKILAIYPSFIKSHFTIVEGLLEELCDRGNEITLISAFRFSNRRDNMDKKKEIFLEGIVEYFNENGISDVFTKHTSAIEDVPNIIYGTAEVVNFTMNYPDVQALLKEDQHFDLVIMDQFQNDAFLGFGHIYRAPVVVTSTTVVNKWVNRCVGNPNNPAINPHLFLGFTDKMDFWQRFLNLVVTIFEDVSYDLMYLPAQESMYKRFFAKLTPAPLPPLIDLIHNVSLVLVNSNNIFHGSRALVPNILEIGGIHVKDPAKALPKDLAHYFSIADGGIFLFTLGGNTKTATALPKEKWAVFNEVFRKLPTVGVFVKWEERVMEPQATNVVIGPWIPQSDMLADPKVRLMITNGGLLTIYEAIYFKTPMVVMPLFGDQFQNAALIAKHGIGRILNFDNITLESVQEAIDDVLENPAYMANVERLHQLMFVESPSRDKLQMAVDQIEFVLKTNGAPHWRSSARDLSVWQLYLVDVTVALLLILAIIVAVPSIIIGIILRKANAARAVAQPLQMKSQSVTPQPRTPTTSPMDIMDEHVINGKATRDNKRSNKKIN